MVDELPRALSRDVASTGIGQRPSDGQEELRQARRQKRNALVGLSIMGVAAIVVLFTLESGVFYTAPCPTLENVNQGGPPISEPIVLGSGPDGGMFFSILADSYRAGCSDLPTPLTSGSVSFSGCRAEKCGGNLTIYTDSEWANASRGMPSPFVWCYPGSNATLDTGPCSFTGNVSFSPLLPGLAALQHSPNRSMNFHLAITSELQENFTAVVNTQWDWEPPPP